MNNMVEIWCSRCGNHERMYPGVKYVKAKTKKGWRSFGSVFYCPECSKTWDTRNRFKINGIEATNTLLYEELFKEHKRLATQNSILERKLYR